MLIAFCADDEIMFPISYCCCETSIIFILNANGDQWRHLVLSLEITPGVLRLAALRAGVFVPRVCGVGLAILVFGWLPS